MKRPNRLSATFIQKINKPGRYGDGWGGYGLSLLVVEKKRYGKPTGRYSKTWSQRLRINGKVASLGLGAYPIVSLVEARDQALENARAVRQGKDPRVKVNDSVPTFEQAAKEVIKLHIPKWKQKDPKKVPGSQKDWEGTFKNHVFPKIGNRLVSEISSKEIADLLVPIWGKRKAAELTRQRISTVMKWAIARRYRLDNPADAEIVKKLLPQTGVKVKNMLSLHYSEVGAAIEKVRQSGAYIGVTLAFEFLVLTATRSQEVREARWSEINFKEQTWTIPAERTKKGREFCVPLSSQAIEVLRKATTIKDVFLRNAYAERVKKNDLVFPSKTGKMLYSGAISNLVKGNGIQAVPHGFRSSFTNWASEQKDDAGRKKFAKEVIDAALSHMEEDKTKAAYFRSELLDLRCPLMEEWGTYVSKDLRGE